MSVLKIELLESGVLLVRLDRPKANTFNLELMAALREAIASAVSRDDVRALVLTGQGGFFSAGLDFGGLRDALMGGPDGALEFAGSMRETFIELWRCPKPTVAAVNGHAIAAGIFLVLCCDHRVVVQGGAEFAVNELQFGAGFPPIAIELGRWAMGPKFAEVIFGAERWGWQAGIDNNSFHEGVASQEELLARAIEKAAALGALPASAYAHVKAQLIAPHLERVLAESPEHAAKTAAIYTSPESVAKMMELLMKPRGAARS
jgi:enoyl-CoA hydratase